MTTVLTILCAALAATNVYTLIELYKADMKLVETEYLLKKKVYEQLFKIFRRK